MTIKNLCLDCSRDQHGCWDRKDDEPLVHCSTFVSKANVTHPCPVCLNHPAPTTHCRMCGAEGEPFVVGEEASGWSVATGGSIPETRPYLVGEVPLIDVWPLPEFKVSQPCACSGEVEKLRAEVEHMRTTFRRFLDPEDLGFAVTAEVRNIAREYLGIDGHEPADRGQR